MIGLRECWLRERFEPLLKAEIELFERDFFLPAEIFLAPEFYLPLDFSADLLLLFDLDLLFIEGD
jgi:hypothetical protein